MRCVFKLKNHPVAQLCCFPVLEDCSNTMHRNPFYFMFLRSNLQQDIKMIYPLQLKIGKLVYDSFLQENPMEQSIYCMKIPKHSQIVTNSLWEMSDNH